MNRGRDSLFRPGNKRSVQEAGNDVLYGKNDSESLDGRTGVDYVSDGSG